MSAAAETRLRAPRPPSRPVPPAELGATSARSLLLTVLGEFALPQAEPVWTQVLLDVLSGLGVESKSARQALARTAAEGLLVSDRAGRRVRWSLTTAGRRLLTYGAARIYGFGRTQPGWDGRWPAPLVSVPESRRQLRHRLRTRLAWAGLGSPAPGVWLSPNPTKQDEVAGVVADLGLTEVTSSFVGPFGAIGSRARRGRTGLGPGRGGSRLRGVPRHVRGRRPVPPRTSCCATRSTWCTPGAASRSWTPSCPAALLPTDWAGARAAELFTAQHDRWHTPAQQQWVRLLAVMP